MIFILAGSSWLFIERQAVVDQMAVWQYQPTEDVAGLADRTNMSDKGRFLYYAAQPELEGSSKFNKDCQRQEEGNAILGCYRAGRIFIYDIKDSRLDGIKEVTAAHEMLHVAYERLPVSERSRIDKLLEDEYSRQNNKELNNRMAYYSRTQPGQRSNELHSIIGTEFLSISSELEQYYARYFTNRSRVVEYFNGYSSKFEAIRSESEKLLKEIESLVNDINLATKSYNDDLELLNSDIDNFNSRAASGQFSSQAEFLAERGVLVQRGESIGQRRIEIERKISEHDNKQARYNSLVDESNSLNRSLDSTLAPPSPGIESLRG
jgi:hypothetical protein